MFANGILFSFELYASNQGTERAKKINAGEGEASQARHKLVARFAVRFANLGLDYEPFAKEGKLIYIKLNIPMPFPPRGTVPVNGMTDTLTYNLAKELLGEAFAGGALNELTPCQFDPKRF